MTTAGETASANLSLPFTFSYPKSVKIRLRHDGNPDDAHIWEERKAQWEGFWRSKGKHALETDRKARVNGKASRNHISLH